MKTGNPFDEKLKAQQNSIPEEILGSSVWVTDTLDLCWASAKAVFEDKATPEIAIAIYDRINQRISSHQKDIN